MVLGLYYHLSEAQLLPMRDDVIAQLAAARTGDRFMSAAGHGRNWQKDNLRYAELRTELTEIMAALKKVNPKRWGRRTTRSYADFSDAQVGGNPNL